MLSDEYDGLVLGGITQAKGRMQMIHAQTLSGPGKHILGLGSKVDPLTNH